MHAAIRRLRWLLIALGCIAVMIEIGLNGYGAWIGESDWWLRLMILATAAILPIGEAAMMLRAGQIHAGKKTGTVGWAYGLWFVCLLGGLFMTLNGASVREDRKEASRVAGFRKYDIHDNAEKQLRRDIDALKASIESRANATITHPDGSVKKVRSLEELASNGYVIRSDRCSANDDDKKKWSAATRTTCQEYYSAVTLQKDRADLKDKEAKLEGAQSTLIGAEVVTSREMPLYRRIREYLSLDPTFLQAFIMTLILHGFTSFVWHTIPARDGDDAESVPDHERWSRHQPVQVHVHAAPAPAAITPPQTTHLLTGGRTFDPAKVNSLLAQYWLELLPQLPKQRQQMAQHLPDFDRVCARENVETPSRDVFCALSAAHLPNVEHLGGAAWFTPS